jgi:hypothetical protein
MQKMIRFILHSRILLCRHVQKHDIKTHKPAVLCFFRDFISEKLYKFEIFGFIVAVG